MTSTDQKGDGLAGVRIAAIVVAVAGLLFVANLVTDALWFWGGTHCTTTAELKACTGVLPAGMVLTTFIGVVFGSALVDLGNRCYRRLA